MLEGEWWRVECMCLVEIREEKGEKEGLHSFSWPPARGGKSSRGKNRPKVFILREGGAIRLEDES